MNLITLSRLSAAVKAGLVVAALGPVSHVFAQEQETTEAEGETLALERIMVTATKREKNIQEVPVSVSALQGDKLDAISSAGMDIRFMNARIPSLSVESSFGRTFPRFYVRGLGNTDFDLNASQPVSLVFDDVVQENAILKGFPVFDVERVEVLRGPQGTLFGRNTPAGIVKFDSVKPSQEFEAYTSVAYGSESTIDFEGAIGGSLTDTLSARVSMMYQDRDDWIDNKAPGFEKNDVLGGYEETAARVQFLYEPNADFSALLNMHYRDLDTTPVAFRANAIKSGSNKLVSGFDRDTVYHDAADFAYQDVETKGANLKLTYEFGDYTLTSISGYESAEIDSRADVDGGYGVDFLGNSGPTSGVTDGDGNPLNITIESQTADKIPDHEQLTQEVRLASNFSGDFNYQVGFFVFSEDLDIESFAYDTLFGGSAQSGYVIQKQETDAWAVFGNVDYVINDKWSMSAGLRYSDDEKDYTTERTQAPLAGCCGQPNQAGPYAVKTDDDNISWDLSATYKVTDNTNWFARVAEGFRAPSIQGRILFSFDAGTDPNVPDSGVTVADSETMLSWETGIKSDLWDNRARVNATVFYYTIDDQQLTAVGGDNNSNALLNADETTGYGFEVDAEAQLTEEFRMTAGMSYNNTEIEDDSIAVAACAICTVTNPLDANGRAIIDGNSLPHAPEWIYNMTGQYVKEWGDGEFFVYGDLAYRSEINFFLYEAKEFEGEALTELGLRVGYAWDSGDNEYEVAVFGRNILDEEVAIGGVDFTNNAAIVNEPRFIGVEFKVGFF